MGRRRIICESCGGRRLTDRRSNLREGRHRRERDENQQHETLHNVHWPPRYVSSTFANGARVAGAAPGQTN